MTARHTLLLLLVLALPAGLAAYGAGPAPGEEATFGPRRFRVEVWSSRPGPGTDVAPLTLESLGLAPAEAVSPVASRPRAAGWVGAAVTSPELFAAIAERPGAEAIFRFETECGAAESARLQVSREFPVTAVDVRGNQRIETTKFQRVGASLMLSPASHLSDGDYLLEMEASAVSALVPGSGPQIFQVKCAGSLRLPDGHTAMFSFTDRVEGEIVGADADRVVEYLVLITRLDLDE